MPLYEYVCDVCAQRFERLESFTADSVQPCPACGGSARRQLGVPALQFKGSGFYVTDYGRGSSHASTSTAPKSQSESSGTGESGGSSCCDDKGCAA